jgi:hypothetical protein
MMILLLTPHSTEHGTCEAPNTAACELQELTTTGVRHSGTSDNPLDITTALQAA